jgi:hypothetical protein
MMQFEYNSMSEPTKVIDPAGRTTTFVYATNYVDMIEIRSQLEYFRLGVGEPVRELLAAKMRKGHKTKRTRNVDRRSRSMFAHNQEVLRGKLCRQVRYRSQQRECWL